MFTFLDQIKIHVVSKNSEKNVCRYIFQTGFLDPFCRIRQTGSLAPAHARNYSVPTGPAAHSDATGMPSEWADIRSGGKASEWQNIRVIRWML